MGVSVMCYFMRRVWWPKSILLIFPLIILKSLSDGPYTLFFHFPLDGKKQIKLMTQTIILMKPEILPPP